jgi:lysophospholipase L1-like esterase
MIQNRWLAAALLAACASVAAGAAHSTALHRVECTNAPELVRLSKPLARVSTRLARNEAIKILAVGSSSTAGAGASRSEYSYPSRLEQELHALLPKQAVKVLNRGVGGEDAKQMLPRLERDLAAEKPDLVIWQVGTNALLGERGVEAQGPLIREGLLRIRATGADVVLLDPQYAPYVLRDPDARPMVNLLAKIGEETGVPVFRRFALMQYWHEARDIAFSDILAPDLFHMNDWSYGCLARSLAAALVDRAKTRPETPQAVAAGASPAPVAVPATTATPTATATLR